MESESPRRRVRRAKQSRPVAPGHAEPVAGTERPSDPLPVVVRDSAALPLDVEAAAVVTEPGGPVDLPPEGTEPEVEPLPDSSRDGAWLPAGITVLVMVSLLVCAGLILIASRQ